MKQKIVVKRNWHKEMFCVLKDLLCTSFKRIILAGNTGILKIGRIYPTVA